MSADCSWGLMALALNHGSDQATGFPALALALMEASKPQGCQASYSGLWGHLDVFVPKQTPVSQSRDCLSSRPRHIDEDEGRIIHLYEESN
eukprot:1150190-Pelagomonas_calceolata.AAC.8